MEEHLHDKRKTISYHLQQHPERRLWHIWNRSQEWSPPTMDETLCFATTSTR